MRIKSIKITVVVVIDIAEMVAGVASNLNAHLPNLLLLKESFHVYYVKRTYLSNTVIGHQIKIPMAH